jgi:fumarate hydratase subunit alpha
MREILSEQIAEAVCSLFLQANYHIGSDIVMAVAQAEINEHSPCGKSVLNQIAQNYEIAAHENIAICQDTGMAVVFADIGRCVHISGGEFDTAINEGVRKAYMKGYLRKSVVSEPIFDRVNTQDNTPAIIYVRIVPGDSIFLQVTAKGFGSENMSAIKMLVPSDGIEGVKHFVIDAVKNAGPNACPPMIVGVGIGGTFEMAALLAKRCTLRPVSSHHPDIRYATLENDILNSINLLGIGPAGLGGTTTALKVNIEFYPTHIAGLPVAVNICCHAARHAEATL